MLLSYDLESMTYILPINNIGQLTPSEKLFYMLTALFLKAQWWETNEDTMILSASNL